MVGVRPVNDANLGGRIGTRKFTCSLEVPVVGLLASQTTDALIKEVKMHCSFQKINMPIAKFYNHHTIPNIGFYIHGGSVTFVGLDLYYLCFFQPIDVLTRLCYQY